jgi:hypothetical protein
MLWRPNSSHKCYAGFEIIKQTGFLCYVISRLEKHWTDLCHHLYWRSLLKPVESYQFLLISTQNKWQFT